MKMDFEEAHNNLRAIRLLYRLLHDNTLSLQNSNSEHLVERARMLLKSLLDVAVESVFDTHLKIVGTQSKESSVQENHVPVLQSKSLMIANNSQSSVKHPQMDELPKLKLLDKKQMPELSKFTFSDNEGTNIETLSNCENSVMQQNLIKATNLSDEKSILLNIENSHHEQQCNDMNALYDIDEIEREQLQKFDAIAGESDKDNYIGPLPIASRQVESLDLKGDFSDDLVNSIKRIESRFLALQLCSNLVESTKNSAGHNTMQKVANLDSPVIQRKDGNVGSHFSQKRSPLEGNRLMKQQLEHKGISSYNGGGLISSNAFEEPFPGRNESWRQSQMPYQNHGLHTNAESARSTGIPKQIGTQSVSRRDDLRSQNSIRPSARNMTEVDRVKPMNRKVSRDTHLGRHASECIQDLRVPLNEDDFSNMPSALPGNSNRESLVRKNRVAWCNQEHKERSSESTYGKKLMGSKASTKEKTPPHQIIIRPTLLDQRSSEIKVLSHQHENSSVLDNRGTHRTNHDEPWKTRRVHPQHEEPELSSSNSNSSSRWTTEEDSTNSSCDSEDYSLPDRTQGSSSRRLVEAKYEGSSEESSNSYPSSEGSLKYDSTGSIKSFRYGHKTNPRKKIGSLRKLKNKLGLIFHHHHHHHHHHRLRDDYDNGSILPKAGHKHSMWNQLQNAFHEKNKHVVLRKGMIDKTRKGAIAKVTKNNQVGQFHRLAEGILTYMRHSKKPNPSKHSGVKGSRSSPHRHSQKKLQPWQILRGRRRGVLKERGRVKTRFTSQKSIKN